MTMVPSPAIFISIAPKSRTFKSLRGVLFDEREPNEKGEMTTQGARHTVGHNDVTVNSSHTLYNGFGACRELS